MGRPNDNPLFSDEDDTPVEVHASDDLQYEPEINETAANNYQQQPQPQPQPQPQQQQYQQITAAQPQYAQAPPLYAQAVPPQYPPPPPPKQIPQQYPPQQYPPQQPQQYPAQKPQAQPNGYPQQTYPPAPQVYVQPPPMQYQAHPGSPYKPVPQEVAGSPAPGYPMQATTQYQPNPPGTQGWSTGLFDCMDDPTNALTTLFVPCVTFGQIAEIIDQGHTSCGTGGLMYGGVAFLVGMPCLLSCSFRTKLRSRYDLIEAPAPDWATHFLCEYCALCQEYRELRNRGFDPAIGWLGNQIKAQQQQQQAPGMNPPGIQTMMM